MLRCTSPWPSWPSGQLSRWLEDQDDFSSIGLCARINFFGDFRLWIVITTPLQTHPNSIYKSDNLDNKRRSDGKDSESLHSHLSRNFAENCGRLWKRFTFVSSSQWRALRTVTPWLIVSLVAMVRGKGTHVNQPPETWEARGTHDKKAPQRKQNLLRPRRCFWVTLKVRTKCLFFL